jgi:hypothetical protein
LVFQSTKLQWVLCALKFVQDVPETPDSF